MTHPQILDNVGRVLGSLTKEEIEAIRVDLDRGFDGRGPGHLDSVVPDDETLAEMEGQRPGIHLDPKTLLWLRKLGAALTDTMSNYAPPDGLEQINQFAVDNLLARAWYTEGEYEEHLKVLTRFNVKHPKWVVLQVRDIKLTAQHIHQGYHESGTWLTCEKSACSRLRKSLEEAGVDVSKLQ